MENCNNLVYTIDYCKGQKIYKFRPEIKKALPYTVQFVKGKKIYRFEKSSYTYERL